MLETVLSILTFISVLIGIILVILKLGRRSQVADTDHDDLLTLKKNQEGFKGSLQNIELNMQKIKDDVNSLKVNGSDAVQDIRNAVIVLQQRPLACQFHVETEQKITVIDTRQQDITRRVDNLECKTRST